MTGKLKTAGLAPDNIDSIYGRIANLSNPILEEQNKYAVNLEWYGKRLHLLRNFYDKSTVDVGFYMQKAASVIGRWERNMEKPSEGNIRKLAELFEVEETFFTSKTIKITINQQIKLK